jgi:hypothetical protein
MAWKQVKVKVEGVVHDANLNDMELHISSDINIGDSVNIDGKKMPVESHSLILRGEINKIILAGASSKKEKSDDGSKQAEG